MSPASTFLRDVASNPVNAAILARWSDLALPNAWLVAGCLFQTVWNVRAGRSPNFGIKDHDIFYFDDEDLSERAEERAQDSTDKVLLDLGVQVEVANQARVHLWYPQHFGRPYQRLTSVEAGIQRFLVRETCVGVRPGDFYAPYGLSGIYAGTLTPNWLTPYPELFERKVASYMARWPSLRLAEGSDDA